MQRRPQTWLEIAFILLILTPIFDELNVPKGLQKAHNIKEGVWGKIVIPEGELQDTINEPSVEVLVLSKNKPGVVEPTILHEVKPLGKVKFYVEFYK